MVLRPRKDILQRSYVMYQGYRITFHCYVNEIDEKHNIHLAKEKRKEPIKTMQSRISEDIMNILTRDACAGINSSSSGSRL